MTETTIAFSHATSFCGAVWDPVIAEVGGAHLVWDHLGHGHARPLPRPFDWWQFGSDVAKRTAEVTGPLLGVGHSMGGTALVMAELLRPGTFDSLVLIEPIILPPPFVAGDNPSAAAARKRRASFESRAEARARLGQKPPFETWNELAFAGYIRDGLRSTGRGEEVALACDPKDEEEIYRTATAHGAWERLGEVAVPVLVMAGGRSDTHDEALIRAIANRFPSAGIEVVAGAGHFLPMERPELVAERIRRLQVVANSSTKPRARSPH